MMHQAQLKRIRRKLKLAAIADKKQKFFAADSHGYGVNPTISIKKIKRFEEEYGVELPLCYAEFLLKVGNGGAGPFYGLYALEEGVGDLCALTETALSRPCLLVPKMSDEDWQTLTADLYADDDVSDEDYDIECAKVFGGLLPIGMQGCSYITALVLNGEYCGRVVNVDVDGSKPVFAFEANFLDWYERWLDEVIAGEVNGWFGYRMGGAEEHLLDKYAYAHEDEVKLDCLEGLLYKKALKPQSMVQVENWLAQEAVSVQHKEVLLQILCKANYEQAKPYLLQWAEQDLTQVCHIVYVYAREHCVDWADWVLQSQDVIQETDDFHARLYVLQAAKADYSDWLVAFATHENVEIRRDAVFYLGMLHHVADYQAVLVQGLQDEDEIVVLYSLSSLGKVKDKDLLPLYQQLLVRFPKGEGEMNQHIRNILKRILVGYKLSVKKLMKMEWETASVETETQVN